MPCFRSFDARALCRFSLSQRKCKNIVLGGVIMPDFFRNWLESLTSSQKDAIWEYFDGSFAVCEDVVTIVGRMDGKTNAGNESLPDAPLVNKKKSLS